MAAFWRPSSDRVAVSVVYSLDVASACIRDVGLELVRPHHLVVLVVGDVAVPHVVSARGARVEGEAARRPRQYVLRSEAHDKARYKTGRHDGGVFPAGLICRRRYSRTGQEWRHVRIAAELAA